MDFPQLQEQIRANDYVIPTAGQAPGYVQANLVILPADWAHDFLRFCQINPKPCPLLAVSEPGQPLLSDLGVETAVDVRTDAPAYYIYRDGQLAREQLDIRDLWQDDFVAFAIGCSFSFEEALVMAGLPVRHLNQGCNVPMFISNIPTREAGPFGGPHVVTMRPFSPRNAIHAIEISSRYPKVHGAPIHIGDPKHIGIKDLQKPDFGDAVNINDSEIPVFWACGVTPQMAMLAAKPPICITHKPGCMLVTEITNQTLSLS
ncbi:uncharacterized protein YcsI (UPF0317 family) [Aestuariispira insulae]|uniref:Putative hydro-lyase DFP90_105152 n=1 Tax=Aestuariispira insulae TaxID=1461337 RepID=A0A3D9HJW4_9PROT|nr:uncharacterized protein YcsI (UPF0317 family) [Aestuariispira insulae]